MVESVKPPRRPVSAVGLVRRGAHRGVPEADHRLRSARLGTGCAGDGTPFQGEPHISCRLPLASQSRRCVADTLIRSVTSLRKEKVRTSQAWFASHALLTPIFYPEYFERSRKSWHIEIEHEKRLDEDPVYADASFNEQIEDEVWSTQEWGAVEEWRNLTGRCC